MRLNKKQKRMLELIKFFLIFSLASIPFHLINWLNIDLYFLESFETRTVSIMLTIFNVKHQLTQTINYDTGQTIPLIIAGEEALGISRECVGFTPIMAFLGLVIASPKRNKRKSLIFVPVIFSVNLARIFFLAIAGVNTPSLVPLLHTIMWSFGMVITVFGLWVYWFNSV